MDKNLKKILTVVSNTALALFVLLVILLAGVRLVGIEPHIVLSGSMEPEILTGSLVYVKPLSPEQAQQLEAGDNVTFVVDKKGTKVTHKIYEVVGVAYVKNQYGELILDENGQPTVAIDEFGNPIVMYTTYGVNNQNESGNYVLDGTPGVGNLASSNVVGKPLFTIPFLGYVAHFVQNPPGRYVSLAICALLIFNIFFDGSSKKKKEEEGAPAAEAPAAEAPDTPAPDAGEDNPTQE
ncbi:MAG: signal peptidase I [Clostridia bacterium]|nr:signal peptidase I [Clostridia bacterium]